MKRRHLSLLAGAILSGGLLFAQAPPAPKAIDKGATLEKSLELALKQNADIMVAESKVRNSEIELNRVRHSILTKVTSLYSDLQAARSQVRVAEKTFITVMEGSKQGRASQQELLVAQGALEQHQAAVQKLEAELKAIRGEFTVPVPALERSSLTTKQEITREEEQLEKEWKLNRITEGEALLEENSPELIPDKIRKQVESVLNLELPIYVKENGGIHPQTINNLSEMIREKSPFFILAASSDMTLRKSTEVENSREVNMTVSGALSFIEDALPTCKFVVKDYGLVLTSKDQIPKGSVDWRKLLPDTKPKKPGA